MSKNFYCITDGSEKVSQTNNYRLLREACEKRGIKFVELFPPEQAWSYADIPVLKDGGMYRLKTTPRVSQYSFALQLKNPGLKVMSISADADLAGPWRSSILADEKGIAIIPSLYGVTKHIDDSFISKIHRELGGFPVVIKVTGGSHGRGVVVVDSPESLRTVVSHIVDENSSASYVVKRFIDQATHYRLVVLDGKVISVIEYLPQEGDIRTNAVKHPSVKPATVSLELQQLAIDATNNEGSVYGGVDILVAADGSAYVAEVNIPCNFSRNQLTTGDDIAGEIVNYLLKEQIA